MLLLAIDTSTSAITVALRGEGVAASATVLDARGHSEHVAPLIERCLASAGCNDRCAFFGEGKRRGTTDASQSACDEYNRIVHRHCAFME